VGEGGLEVCEPKGEGDSFTARKRGEDGRYVTFFLWSIIGGFGLRLWLCCDRLSTEVDEGSFYP
jgi:hypothetical protein